MISANPYELMLPYIYTIFWVILAIAIPLIVMKIIVKALSKYDDEDATEKTLIKRIISIIHYMTVILIIISIQRRPGSLSVLPDSCLLTGLSSWYNRITSYDDRYGRVK